MSQLAHEQSNSRKRRKNIVLACLAGGVVLGVGAAVTLAAWNDDVFTQGTFTAGTFDVQGSTDGGTSWVEADTAGGAATLAFTLGGSTLQTLSPGDTVYAPFALHTATGTTNGADISIPTVTGDGGAILPNLSYTLVETSSATCDATAVAAADSTVIVPAGTAITGGTSTTTAFSLDPATTTAAGAPTYLCYAVTAGDALAQGQTGTVTWDFHATSNSTTS
jgi:predicted ribosomally synthesized peptide with SipW-like signal peptide